MLLTFGANAALVFTITLFLLKVMGCSQIEICLIFVPARMGGLTALSLRCG